MIDPHQFLTHVIVPTLEWLRLDSPSARALLLGTALAESNLTYIAQRNDGPAMGVYQMEPNTHDDIWDNFLYYHKDLGDRTKWLMASWPNKKGQDQLMTNLNYATAMCRIHYYRVRDPLPAPEDINGLANYWKVHYNTLGGKGKPLHFAQASAAVLFAEKGSLRG